MNKIKLLSVIAAVALVSSCAAITPTYKTEEGFVVYDLKANKSQSIDREKLMADITNTLKTHASQLRINRSIPPSPLPKEPGRFKITNPFQGTGIGAIAGSRAASLKVAVCDDALMVASSENTGMAQYGEQQNFTICVYQYAQGYSMNIYVSSVEATGGFSTATLGATISKAVTGGSSQFIPRTINELKLSMERHGQVKEVDKYIPESFTGLFYSQAQ